MPCRKTHNGFTLLELILSLAIVVILTGLVVPAFAGLVRRTQTELYVHHLVNTFQLARSAAISRREPVVLCANLHDNGCGSDWSRGALLFTDPNGNRLLDADEQLLAQVEPPTAGTRVIMKAALNKNYLRVLPNGMLENTAGSLLVCAPGARPQDARNLIFSRNGRLRFGGDRNHDGIPENAEGQPLSCPSS